MSSASKPVAGAGEAEARAVQLAAAGGHHLAIVRAPPAGTVLARRVRTLLPDLDRDSAEDVAALRRAAGLPVGDEDATPARPPWRTVEHTIGLADLIGTPTRPGAVSLAHRGVLHIAHALQLPTGASHALTRILDDHRVEFGNSTTRYPARPRLVLTTTTGCPTGQTDCACRPGEHRRDRQHLSGLLDRIDLRISAADAVGPAEPTATDAARIATAAAASADRWWRLTPRRGCTNNDTPATALAASLRHLSPPTRQPLRRQVDTGTITARGAAAVLRVAGTIADLDGRPAPNSADVAEAITWRTTQL